MYSLSKYYPKNTVYFFTYPAGFDSNYWYTHPHWTLEVATGRPMVCAGDDVSVLTYARVVEKETIELLRDELGTPVCDLSKVISLPPHILPSYSSPELNAEIKKAIPKLVEPGQLIMAQPFTDPALNAYYQISPELLFLVNDKKKMAEYIPASELPKKYGFYQTGAEFAATSDTIPTPCVVKISSSAGGTGVAICRTPEDLENAKKRFSTLEDRIFAEQFIEPKHNLCVQFGIPSDASKPCEIIGFHEQIVKPDGTFLGGIVDPEQKLSCKEKLYASLTDTILPNLRKLGWYGIGGFDVLIDKDDNIYWIDPNMRMTGTIAFVIHVRNGLIKKPVASFLGTFKGTEKEFREKIVSRAKFGSPDQLLDIVALVRDGDEYRISAAFLFEPGRLAATARQVLDLGITSGSLEQLATYSR